MTQIRNIIQTVQEREIIKTAPDVVVFLDGLPYIVNKYLHSEDGHPYVLVNFNDHVVSYNAGYDVDNFIPTCNIVLSVPNHQKFLYQAPGGNNALQTMMELQVFAKGYYLSKKGDSVYRRVFKGLVNNLSYTDNGKTLEISMSGSGIMRFFELMQVDLNPALMTNSATPAQPFATRYANMNAYRQIQATFLDTDFLQGFQTAGTVADSAGKIKNSAFAQAVEAGYITKWQSILTRLIQDVHVFAVKDTSDPLKFSDKHGTQAGANAVEDNKKYGTEKESDMLKNLYIDEITKYLPDMSFAQINLVTGRIISRLERLRVLVQLIGFEGYQDIDGKIIIKPPLYNLDVTNVTDEGGKVTGVTSDVDIYEENNPFVINLSEILSESEVEDERAIRYTRMLIKGNINRSLQVAGTEELIPAAEFIDIPKLAQFGLREEPPRVVPWLASDDQKALFNAAVYELVRGNRGYRQYSCTIPLRPELKLGFPVFLPHKDVYGYVKSITINYQSGATAVMHLVLDTLRRRPMFPVQQMREGQEVTVYSKQPNLVYLWTKDQNSVTTTTTPPQYVPFSSDLQGVDIPGVDNPQDSGAVLENKPASVPTAAALLPDQRAALAYRDQKIRNFFGTEADTPTEHFRLQKETDDYFTASKNKPIVDETYFQTIRKKMPFTDAKGYEVVTPFPWGRYITLKHAIDVFTRGGTITSQQTTDSTKVLDGINTFLFAGLGTPSGDVNPGGELYNQLNELAEEINKDSIFILTYDSFGNETNPITTQPSSISSSIQTLEDAQKRASVFVSGALTPDSKMKDTLQIITSRTEEGK
jgi:hypothetical protein